MTGNLVFRLFRILRFFRSRGVRIQNLTEFNKFNVAITINHAKRLKSALEFYRVVTGMVLVTDIIMLNMNIPLPEPLIHLQTFWLI